MDKGILYLSFEAGLRFLPIVVYIFYFVGGFSFQIHRRYAF